jgi:hypothetical protein
MFFRNVSWLLTWIHGITYHFHCSGDFKTYNKLNVYNTLQASDLIMSLWPCALPSWQLSGNCGAVLTSEWTPWDLNYGPPRTDATTYRNDSCLRQCILQLLFFSLSLSLSLSLCLRFSWMQSRFYWSFHIVVIILRQSKHVTRNISVTDVRIGTLTTVFFPARY